MIHTVTVQYSSSKWELLCPRALSCGNSWLYLRVFEKAVGSFWNWSLRLPKSPCSVKRREIEERYMWHVLSVISQACSVLLETLSVIELMSHSCLLKINIIYLKLLTRHLLYFHLQTFFLKTLPTAFQCWTLYNENKCHN